MPKPKANVPVIATSTTDKFWFLATALSEVLTTAYKSGYIEHEVAIKLATSINNRFDYFMDQAELFRNRLEKAIEVATLEVDAETAAKDTLNAEFGLAPDDEGDEGEIIEITHKGNKGGRLS